jgi:hypothetical protein
MTLIAEIHDKKVGSVFFADCLVSFLHPGRPTRNQFPLHFGSGRSIDTFGVGLASKFLTSQSAMITGAGEVRRMLDVFQNFFAFRGDLKGFQACLDEVYEHVEYSQRERYIYGASNGDSGSSDHSFYSCSYCCERFSVGHLDIICGGSGASELKENFAPQLPDKNVSLLALAVQMLAHMIRLEFVKYGHEQARYGSAYELLFVDLEGRPRRIPYAIVDLSVTSKMVGDRVFDIDATGVSRIMLSIPNDNGTIFVVLSEDGEGRFDVRELGAERPEEEAAAHLSELFVNFLPRFNIIMAHHEDVNFAVGRNNVSIKPLDAEGDFEVHVDYESALNVFREYQESLMLNSSVK